VVVETWKKLGKVEVTRNSKGHFITWRKYVPPIFPHALIGKSISVYGIVWTNYGPTSYRYEFPWESASGREIYEAVRKARHIPPKKPVTRVNVRDFLANPYKYGMIGFWTNFGVES
jgi:hypothetical protein